MENDMKASVKRKNFHFGGVQAKKDLRGCLYLSLFVFALNCSACAVQRCGNIGYLEPGGLLAEGGEIKSKYCETYPQFNFVKATREGKKREMIRKTVEKMNSEHGYRQAWKNVKFTWIRIGLSNKFCFEMETEEMP